MSDLDIGRLTATVTDGTDLERDLVPHALRHVANHRLTDALRNRPLPEGEWCIRRLDVDFRLDPERPTSALESQWADLIVAALHESLRGGDGDVVRYERHEDAVDDLLSGLASGDLERDWAWRQIGLLEGGDPSPEPPRTVCLRVLGRLSHGVAAAMCRLVQQVGPAAVHRLLGSSGWAQVATLAARQAGVMPTLSTDDVAGSGRRRALPAGDRSTDGAGRDTGVADADRRRTPVSVHTDRARLATTVAGSSVLARSFRRSGLRPDPPTRHAWATLVLAEVDASALRRADAQQVLRTLGDILTQPVDSGLQVTRTALRHRQDAVVRGDSPPRRDPSAHTRDARAAEPVQAAAPHESPGTGTRAPAVPRHGAVTAWGGLLFLLNSATDAGLPEALAGPPFLTRPTPWLVQQLALRLVPTTADDPAVLALSGLDPELPATEPPPDDAEADALDDCALAWASATVARLLPDTSDEEASTRATVVRSLSRRTATVVREPGWVEVHLRLDDVDLAVRRSGLDIDPGWVWWLGHVVRFHYE